MLCVSECCVEAIKGANKSKSFIQVAIGNQELGILGLRFHDLSRLSLNGATQCPIDSSPPFSRAKCRAIDPFVLRKNNVKALVVRCGTNQNTVVPNKFVLFHGLKKVTGLHQMVLKALDFEIAFLKASIG
jgi:hypothetical protein